jgi:DNA replication and repair protein RecF
LLEARLSRDLERGTTGAGPHLDDVLVASGDRDLRQYGSQGEQRLAVLSLLLAEAELLPAPPLLLLDDVLSELDLGRREVLARRLAGMGQTMITATHRSALPIEPAQVIEVEHGFARDGSARP